MHTYTSRLCNGPLFALSESSLVVTDPCHSASGPLFSSTQKYSVFFDAWMPTSKLTLTAIWPNHTAVVIVHAQTVAICTTSGWFYLLTACLMTSQFVRLHKVQHWKRSGSNACSRLEATSVPRDEQGTFRIRNGSATN